MELTLENLAAIDWQSASVDVLADIAARCADEQRRRAVDGGDLEALTTWGFDNMFGPDGMPRDPVLKSGVLVVAGTRKDKSKQSHDCVWTAVGDSWVWEYEDTLSHVLRHLPTANKTTRAVTLLVPYEGLEFDVVTAKLRSGAHSATASKSYTIRSGELACVSTRTRAADHRN